MKILHLGGPRYEFRGGKGVSAIGSYSEQGEGKVNELIPNAKYRPSMLNISNVAWILSKLPRGRLVAILRAARLAAPRAVRMRDVQWTEKKP